MDHFAEYPSLPSSTHAINRAVVVTATLLFFLVGEGDKQDGGALSYTYTLTRAPTGCFCLTYKTRHTSVLI